MFDWVLNMPLQTSTLVNKWKKNIGSLQSTQCNEARNRKKDEVNKVGPTENFLQCKNKIRNSKEAQPRPRSNFKKIALAPHDFAGNLYLI